jgi:ATP-dependent DNA ligase
MATRRSSATRGAVAAGDLDATFPRFDLPIAPPYPPMEARSAATLPAAEGWIYEPKWDGFRCLAFRDGSQVALQSKSGQALTRYFPELIEALLALPPRRFVLDGEIVIMREGLLHFDDLLQRIHPAQSRIRKLAGDTPATLLMFDLLVDDRGHSLVSQPLTERRARLEAFAAALRGPHARLDLSPSTTDHALATRWMSEFGRAGLDGIIAKRAGEPYHSGGRDAMIKVKRLRTADCVVGGLRWAGGNGRTARSREIGSLLLGLYGGDGLLHYVGHAASFDAATRHALTTLFLPLVNGAGFSGDAPGPNRWDRGRTTDWVPVRPDRVVEVV